MSYAGVPRTGFVIDKDIPIPGRRNLVKTPLRLALEGMQVGDSIFIESAEQHDRVHGMRTSLMPRRFSSRKVDGGWRVWRIE